MWLIHIALVLLELISDSVIKVNLEKGDLPLMELASLDNI